MKVARHNNLRDWIMSTISKVKYQQVPPTSNHTLSPFTLPFVIADGHERDRFFFEGSFLEVMATSTIPPDKKIVAVVHPKTNTIMIAYHLTRSILKTHRILASNLRGSWLANPFRGTITAQSKWYTCRPWTWVAILFLFSAEVDVIDSQGDPEEIQYKPKVLGNS